MDNPLYGVLYISQSYYYIFKSVKKQVCLIYSDILRRCIVEQIAKMMVLPNKLPIKLSDEIPTVDLRMPEPEVSYHQW